MEVKIDDLRKIVAGIIHDGIDVEKLTPTARAELRQALDTVLRIYSQK